MRSKFNVGRLIWDLVRVIISNIIFAVIGLLLSITVIVPILMVILALLNTVSYLISLIGYCMTYAEVTERGIHGRSGFRGFDLTFDQVALVESAKKTLVITTNIPKKEGSSKVKTYRVNNAKNSDELKAAYVNASSGAPIVQPEAEKTEETAE